MPDQRIELIQLLAPRLERLSVDSIWARRSSGLRRSLVKALEAEAGHRPLDPALLDNLIERTFDILAKSAREIPDPARQLWSKSKEVKLARSYTSAKPTDHQRLPEHSKDEAWIRAFLHRIEIAHIGHAADGQPFVTPTNFWYDEDGQRIIFHANIAGRLRANLESNPQVCLEISEMGRFLPANTALEFGVQYRSVMVFGRVEILKEPDEQRRVLYALISKYFPRMSPGREYRPIADKELARTTVYALQIESWSGKENWKEKADESPDWPPLPEGF